MQMTRLFDERDRAGEDRRLILVETASRQQGIAAALRRAFEAVESNANEEFEALLRRM
jgi:hypothetical protein